MRIKRIFALIRLIKALLAACEPTIIKKLRSRWSLYGGHALADRETDQKVACQKQFATGHIQTHATVTCVMCQSRPTISWTVHSTVSWSALTKTFTER